MPYPDALHSLTEVHVLRLESKDQETQFIKVETWPSTFRSSDYVRIKVEDFEQIKKLLKENGIKVY